MFCKFTCCKVSVREQELSISTFECIGPQRIQVDSSHLYTSLTKAKTFPSWARYLSHQSLQCLLQCSNACLLELAHDQSRTYHLSTLYLWWQAIAHIQSNLLCLHFHCSKSQTQHWIQAFQLWRLCQNRQHCNQCSSGTEYPHGLGAFRTCSYHKSAWLSAR